MFIVHSHDLRSCRLVFILSLVWFICTGAAIQGQPEPESKGASDKAAKIKTLLKERHDLLTKVVAQVTDQYNLGAVDFESVAQAEQELLKATVELEEVRDKRITLLQEDQKLAEVIVAIAERWSKSAQGGKVDALRAKAILLEVQIELLREEEKVEPRK
jgi:hypothetical protein